MSISQSYNYTYTIDNIYNTTSNDIQALIEHLKTYYLNFEVSIDVNFIIFKVNVEIDKTQLEYFIKILYVKETKTTNLLTIPVDVYDKYWKTIIEWKNISSSNFKISISYVGSGIINSRIIDVSNNTICATSTNTIDDILNIEIEITVVKNNNIYELQSYVNEKYIKIKSVKLII